MLRLSTFCKHRNLRVPETLVMAISYLIASILLAQAIAQSGYDYNKPNRPFGPGTSSSRPGTSPGYGGTTTTSYPIRQQSDDYNALGGPTTGYPTGPQNYPGSGGPTTGYPTGPQSYPGSGGSGGQRPGHPGSSYPGQGPSGSSERYPGQSDSTYSQGSRPSSSFPSQGSRYPGQGQNNLGISSFSDSDTGNYEGGDYSAIPGEPDIDYPILSYIPQTSFSCKSQSLPGYYADVETRCQVFHICSNNITYDFLCPNGTVFSQEDFVCVWWNQFNCDSAPGLYELNAKLYDYSIRGSPGDYQVSSFSDYNGSSYPGGRQPQGPSSYPSSGTSRPSGYPGSSGPSTPYPGAQSTNSYPGSQGPAGGYQGPQGPSSSYPGPQGPSSSYPGSQGPSSSYPGSQGPSSNYPGSQGPSSNYPGSQGPSSNYPGSQGPSSNYPGSQGPSSNYPGSQGPSGTYSGYPESGSYQQGPQGPQGPPGSPGNQSPGHPASGPSTAYPGSSPGSQGYPSGRPSGPSFQPGGSSGRPVQKPNREYLPPRN